MTPTPDPAVDPPPTARAPDALERFFAARGWSPLDFQRRAWSANLARRDCLISVPTGSGKTYAAVLPDLALLADDERTGLRLLYLTPLRAVSRDIEAAIAEAAADLGLPHVRVEARTGDTSSHRKRNQLDAMPQVLVTTPESLSLMLSYPGAAARFARLRTIVVDEWHELLATKRGSLLELALARLRRLAPAARTTALSATLSDLDLAARAAVGADRDPVVLRSDLRRETRVRSLIPDEIDSFPWAGHLGMRMLPAVLEALDPDVSTLIFTNTRRQAERWFEELERALTSRDPELAARVALHHGSIAKAERERIEAGVKGGAIRWVVCTSSLDLGVDFQPVERVVQIGSAKGVARLLQRAGRSAHVPEGVSDVTFVPTHALELLEISAARRALEAGRIEARHPIAKPYDVLAQHLVTLACGDGVQPDALFDEVRTAQGYADLDRTEFDWIVAFVRHGGRSLRAYPEYAKLREDDDGLLRIASERLRRRHRMGIGTITGDAVVKVSYTNRKPLGSVEERFIGRLKPGDVFTFAGRRLELVMLKDLQAYVRTSTKRSTRTPAWAGGRLPLTDALSAAVRDELAVPRDATAELRSLAPILDAQERLSAVPDPGRLLIEVADSREGRHLFLFPFEGRRVHEGLAALLATRLAAARPATFAMSVNDYGLELLGPDDYPFAALVRPELFAADGLDDDIVASLNLSELAKRRFRGIAQIAGLIFAGYPGTRKGARQTTASSGTLYEMFRRYEPDSLLLAQARREVLEQNLERSRLAAALARMRALEPVLRTPPRVSPFAFPLLVERLSARHSGEDLARRIERLKARFAKAT